MADKNADLSNQEILIECVSHYSQRELAHCELRTYFEAARFDDFAKLALGIGNHAGNYSASEHSFHLGQKILSENTDCPNRLYQLACDIGKCERPSELPNLISGHDIRNLGLSVGTEIATMLWPDRYWIGNRRTYWAYMLVKNGYRVKDANQALAVYGKHDTFVFMPQLYTEIEPQLRELGKASSSAVTANGLAPGKFRYLWPDAVASVLFSKYAV